LGSHSQSQSTIRQTSTDMVGQNGAVHLNSYLSLNDLNTSEQSPNYNSHYKSVPNLSSDTSLASVESTPLIQHPLCQTNSYYSDSTDENHGSNTIENSSLDYSNNATEQQEFSGELEFAAAYTMELSQQSKSKHFYLTQRSEKSPNSCESSDCASKSSDSLSSSGLEDSNNSQNTTKNSTKSNVSADNNFNNLTAKKPSPGNQLKMLAAIASPSPATLQRRYRIQSCDIMETGSWIICDNIF